VADIAETESGLLVTIGRSKTEEIAYSLHDNRVDARGSGSPVGRALAMPTTTIAVCHQEHRS